MDRYINTVLDGRYEIENIIGVGGMAVVYKARDNVNGNEVAVKIMKDELRSNKEFQRRFLNETKTITMLNHANIVQVVDAAVRNDIQYIVMEYVKGITLKEYINRKGVVKQEEAVHFIIQILKALRHAHSKGIVHRDIKPQNIMLLENGNIKVADFGIAKMMNCESQTLTDQTIGSVHYISPEQVKGQNVDERSDIYSTGIVLYEMLTGRLPFDGDTPVSVALMQINNKAIAPREIVPTILKGLEEITLKAICKNPKNRYATVIDMLIDFDSFVHNPKMVFGYDFPDDDYPQDEVQTPEKEVEDVRTSSSLIIPTISGIASAFVIIALVSAGILFFGLQNKNNGGAINNSLEIPDLVGQMVETVKLNAEYDNFNIVEMQQMYSDEIEAGKVISQEPAAGTPAMQGRDILVVVSRGKNEFFMPEVGNMEYRQALIKLSNEFRLETKEEREFSPTVIKDYVTRTQPAAGEPVNSNDVVTVFISKGIEMMRVPDLSGMTLDMAVTTLMENKLMLGEVISVESDQPEMTIVGQGIAAESLVEKNSSVDVEVSQPLNGSGIAPSIESERNDGDNTDDTPNNIGTNTGSENTSSQYNSTPIFIQFPFDKDEFILTIYSNKKEVYSKKHYAYEGSFEYIVKEDGAQRIEIYIDDELYGTQMIGVD